MFNRTPKFETKPGTCEIGEPRTEGNVTIVLYKVTFYPIKFPRGVWYYKEQPRTDSKWVWHTYTRVFPWDDPYWWKARYGRSKNWIKKNVRKLFK